MPYDDRPGAERWSSMYDTRNSSAARHEARRGLREKLTLKRLVSITAILIALSLFLSWPPAPSTSAKYSPWNNTQPSFLQPGIAQALGSSTPTPISAAPAFAITMPTV